MRRAVAETLPFRWNLITPDRLGSLLPEDQLPEQPQSPVHLDPSVLHGLVVCAGKVLARSGNGDLVFVGRSLDSMFDLLSGALADLAPRPDLSYKPDLHRLPVSFSRSAVRAGRRWRLRPFTPAEITQVREYLAGVGVTPHGLARRSRPVTFVDVVHEGGTFTDLFGLLRTWIDDERQPWRTIRGKIRFVGVTIRRETSPNTWRWQQDAEWTSQLPSRSVVNVSLDHRIWSYLGDYQVKLTRTHKPEHWLADAPTPARDDRTRNALAEALAFVSYGRSHSGRQAIARATSGEPALSEAWLRTLVTTLNNN